MDKLVTFAIAAYNSEKFLEKCLDSFLIADGEEGYEKRMEVLIVNDGSKDATEEIALQYQKNYPEIYRVISKANGGHGSVINRAVKEAKGKYFKVIDADDWIEKESLGSFLKGLEQTNVDVVLTHYKTYDVRTGEIVWWKTFLEDYDREYDLTDVWKDWKSMDRCLTFHGITYRTSFYKQWGIELVEHVFYEDHQYATIPCCYAASIQPIDKCLYIYRIGDIKQSVSDKNQYLQRSHTRIVILEMSKYLKNSRIDGAGRFYYEEKLGRLILSYLVTVLLLSPIRAEGRVEAKELLEQVQADCQEVYKKMKKRYYLLKFCSCIRISNRQYHRMLESRIYNRIRKNKDFQKEFCHLGNTAENKEKSYFISGGHMKIKDWFKRFLPVSSTVFNNRIKVLETKIEDVESLMKNDFFPAVNKLESETNHIIENISSVREDLILALTQMHSENMDLDRDIYEKIGSNKEELINGINDITKNLSFIHENLQSTLTELHTENAGLSKAMYEKIDKNKEELIRACQKRSTNRSNTDINRQVWDLAGRETAEYVTKYLSKCITSSNPGALRERAVSHIELEGLYLEFGVFSGKTINQIAELKPDQIIYGFDSFEGLPETWRTGFYEKKFATDMLPEVHDNVRLIKGWFSDTLPVFLEEHTEQCAFIHVDCDLYLSAKCVFENLKNRITKGTIIVFDEYFNYPSWKEHEYKAFQEFIKESGLSYEYLSYVPNWEQVAVKIM